MSKRIFSMNRDELLTEIERTKAHLNSLEMQYKILTGEPYDIHLANLDWQKLQALKDDDTPIEKVRFSVRIFNRLKVSGYHTVADIVNSEPEKISAIKRLGNKSLCDIAAELTRFMNKKARASDK